MKKSIICFLLILINACLVFVKPTESLFANAVSNNEKTEVSITAKSGLLLDFDTGTVVFEKNANERLPIASMTKLATLSVVFDFIDKGIVKENDMVVVSSTAADVGGSSAFLDAGASYKLSELVKSVIIASANDSSVALAEHVAGTEDVFVSKMNKLASSLGLENTHFENCTGLPSDNHYSSAYDIAKIYKTMCNHEIYKKYAKIWMDDFVHPSGRKTGLVNTNRLVKTFDGIEGGKTGYTDAARFCLTASAKRGNTRLIGVVIGANDSKTRFAEMSKLFGFGFANFQTKVIVAKEIPVTLLKLKNAKREVEIYPEKDIVKFVPKTDDVVLTTDFQLNELKAPLKAGDVVGKIFAFDKNNMVVDEANLIVNENVSAVGVKETLKKLVEKW